MEIHKTNKRLGLGRAGLDPKPPTTENQQDEKHFLVPYLGIDTRLHGASALSNEVVSS